MPILKVLNGAMAGQTWRLTDRPLTLGRHSSSDIVVRNPRVSRSHVRLYHCRGKFLIEDLGSRNGTVVNGSRIHVSTQLKDRDWIEIGDTIFEFSDEGRIASPDLPDTQRSQGLRTDGGGVIERPTAEYVPSYESVCGQASPQVKLQAVLQITRDLGTCLDSDAIYQRTLDCVARVFPHAASVEILQTDGMTGGWTPITRSKLPANGDGAVTSRRGLNAAAKQAISSRTAVVSDIADDSAESPTEWLVCAPLTAPGGDFFGVINLEFPDASGSCSGEDQEVLTCLAILAAQSLAHVRAHSERYRAVVDTSAQAILTFDDAGVIESANPASGLVFACPTDTLVGRNIAGLFPQLELQSRHGRERFLSSYLRKPGEAAVEVIGRRADKQQFPAEISLAEFKLDGWSHFTIVCQDISERKRATKDLRDSRERLSCIVQTGIVGIAFGDLRGRIVDVNGAFSRLTGYSREELIEATDGWRKLTAPEYVEEDRQALLALRADGMYGPYEREFICRNGRRLPVSVSAALLPGNTEEYVVFVIDNSRQKKAEQQLRQLNASLEKTVAERTRNIRLLQDVAVIANAADSIEEAFEAAVENICRHVGWPAGCAFLNKLEEGSESFVQVGQWPSRHPAASNFGRSPDHLVVQVIHSGNPARSDTASATWPDPRSLEVPGEAIVSALAFPVRLGAKVWGVLEFFATPSTMPSDDLLQLMSHVCAQLGRVVERRQLQQELIDTVWNQHRRFGQELHDTLGQELTGIRMMAESLCSKLESQGSPEARAMAELTQYIREAQDHARRLSKGLLPVDIFQEGLTAALEDLADHATKQTAGLDCVFVSESPIEVQGNELATHLFRIAQEAVNNAIKHSGAQRIELSLVERGSWLTLEISDDGTGLEETVGASFQGMGLRIMRYRANAIGGTLTIERGGNRGTKVRCTVEIHHDAEQRLIETQSQTSDCG